MSFAIIFQSVIFLRTQSGVQEREIMIGTRQSEGWHSGSLSELGVAMGGFPTAGLHEGKFIFAAPYWERCQ